ncbi:MAG: protein kinase domain-containing protein [Ruminiclostridium sp.]
MQQNSFHSKYKYIKTLGHGGCGDVFLAENITLGNLWAVKEIVKGEKTSICGYIEPEILKRLNHPALPRICDVYEDETKIYIVEDYLEGICLKQEFDIKGNFDERTVIDWAIQLCNVLEYLHCQKPNPIIYGDMKPHNIILTKEGFVKLIDFGVSVLMAEVDDETTREEVIKYEKIKDENIIGEEKRDQVSRDKATPFEYAKVPCKASYATAFIGTKGYAAPEQFIGNGISIASDIYSLGITLIQLVTGIDPLKSINIIQDEKYIDYLSPGLFDLLRKCVHPNPVLRYKTAGILMKELRQYSLRNDLGNENNINSLKKSLNFTKIIAITGARGTGTSTIAAAMAEYMARGPTSACIVDLSLPNGLGKSLSIKLEKNPSNRFEESPSSRSEGSPSKRSEEESPTRFKISSSGRLEKSLTGRFEKSHSIGKENSNSSTLIKINSNLYYFNLNNLSDIYTDELLLHKQLGQLQDSFSYVFIDVDITLLKFIEQYLNHIFIISDMNAFNVADIGQMLKAEGMIAKCISRTAFIINKYYKGELSSRNILQSMLSTGDTPEQLQDLIVYAKVFEVPYDQKVYLKWMYSFFGEPLRFKNFFNDDFGKAISNIISNTISPQKRKCSRLSDLIQQRR